MLTDGFKGAANLNAAFSKLKEGLLSMDPVWFCENNLTLDGEVFRLHGNGYKPFSDIYRYVGIKALEKDGKPVVIVKGRQVGATTMAAALELYLMACGLFGTQNRSPVRVMHCFPLLDLAYTYTKTKLNPMISAAILDEEAAGTSKPRSKIETKIDNSTGTADSLKLKQFINGNQILIESTGLTADRIRGRTVDVILYDECFPYDQFIETNSGKEKIGNLYKKLKNKQPLPMVKTYNEKEKIFEYKNILNAWERPYRQLVKIHSGHKRIKCTPNHRFLTKNGWKEAGDLKKGDLLKSSVDTDLYVRAVNEDQFQIIIGSFLGDGNLSSHKNNRYRLRVTHGIDQEEYCSWKASCFEVDHLNVIKKNGYSKKPAVNFATKNFGLEHELPKTKSTCPQWVLDKLDAKGLAIWFMDDGCVVNKVNARISTCSFDEESHERMVTKLNSMGIDCNFKKTSRGYNSIFLNKAGYSKLCELIAPYVHSNMEYKVNYHKNNLGTYNWKTSFEKYSYSVVDKVTQVEKKEKVYDIEVEDNHNFIVTTGRKSKSLGGPIAHNCQDIPGVAIANANKTLSQAKYGPPGSGAQVYFGTPKQKGSAFWDIWQQSSQQYYYLGCEECEEYFPLYTPGSNDWEDIWIEDDFAPDYKDPKTGLKPHGFVVKCTHCGHEQDKRPAAERGKWMPLRGEEFDNKFVGYHINQLYMPHLSRSKVIGEKPENNPINTERAYQNEVLGEFFAGDAAPITADQIEEICADKKRTFRRSIGLSENKRVYVGADWGQKIDADALAVGEKGKRQRGQSYSSVVVLSAEGPGILSIEYAKLLKKNDLEYKKAFIDETFRRYSVHLGVGDIGYANDLTEILQRDYNDRFLASRAVGSVKHHAKVSLDTFPKEIAFERDYYIAELFDLMKAGKIRFPYGSYEQIGWLVQHCCSMEIKPTIDRSGNVGIRYTKGSTPNDGFMALLNAYLAYKFDITKGFNIVNPNRMREDPSKPEPPAAIAAHLPGLNSWKRDGMRRRR